MLTEIKRLAVAPLVDANPITVQALGICSALAVTSGLRPSLLMAAAVVSVCGCANASISLIRRVIPQSIRLIVQIIVIASFVVVADELLKAFAPETSKRLSVYVFVIVTNCIVLARVESFAMHHRAWASFVDGVGNGLGYGLVLAVIPIAMTLIPQVTLKLTVAAVVRVALVGVAVALFASLIPARQIARVDPLTAFQS